MSQNATSKQIHLLSQKESKRGAEQRHGLVDLRERRGFDSDASHEAGPGCGACVCTDPR
jgi:hypothetical protein